MERMLLLEILFACVACDGKIDKKEVSLLRKFLITSEQTKTLNVDDILQNCIKQINEDSNLFFSRIFEKLSVSELSKQDELALIKDLIDIIESDNIIDYQEIKFLKRVKSNLHLTNEELLEIYPDNEDYFVDDIQQKDIDKTFSDLQYNFSNIGIEDFRVNGQN
jgi:uncharacterized tellurite resistance protein B-like protein